MTDPAPKHAALITSRNCREVVGLPFERVIKLAQQHGVPVYVLSARTRAVHAQRFMAALETAAAADAQARPRKRDALDLLLGEEE